MNNFDLITKDFNAGIITPLQFVKVWSGELNKKGMCFDAPLQRKINKIFREANDKMSDVVKEIQERQGFLADLNFDKDGK